MPQAKQGGKGVWIFAVAVSKFAGTGLEKEHIGQTHVAVLCLGELDADPPLEIELVPRCIGEAVELREGESAALCGLGKGD